jgi:Leucine-rich repeat (LRR) protein
MLSATGLKSIAGITKASDMRRLHITDNDLTGTFPEDIFELTQLRSLYLSFNMFTGPLPTKLSALTNLEEFYVFGNRIEGSIPSAAIAPLTNIREFIMANNFLTGKIPDVFNNLPALEQLSLFGQLSDSLLTGTLPNFLGAPTMWYFDISGNDLTGTIPKDFMKNSKWHDSDVTVYLSNNELTGAVPTELNAFTSLDLSIIGNSITGLPSVLCGADNANWMQGQLGTIGSCDAIACPPGTFNLQGRQDATSNPCQSCPASAGDNRFGQTHCEDISTEKATLEALYSATGGTNWSGQSKWISSEPICSWEGILCENGNVDDDSGVTGIDLEEHNLDGTIPKSVWKLPFLTSFNVKHNEDLYITFDGLSAASALELLYLSEVNIDTLEGISKASSLRQLHITGCGVSGPFPNELFELGATLDGLFMAYNSMTGTLSTRFGELSNLESFYAFDNEFSGKIPTQIGMMSKLHRVGKYDC